MPNLVLSFAELLAGAVILDAGIKGDSIQNVIKGQATSHSLAGSSTASGSSSANSASTLPAGTYTNPFPGAQGSRIDQGVDLTGKQFLAPGKSQILVADQANPGWAGGGYIAAKLLDGPLAGTVYYIAEGVAPLVQVGQTVSAGQPLGRPVSNPYNGIIGNIEAGWASLTNPGQPLAQTLSGYSGDQSTAGLTAGYSFSNFWKALGGVGGIFQGAGQALSHAIQQEFSGGQTPAGVPFG